MSITRRRFENEYYKDGKVYLEGQYNIMELLTICKKIANTWNNHNCEFYWNDDDEIVFNTYLENPVEQETDVFIDFD